jgi:hypothetical protein
VFPLNTAKTVSRKFETNIPRNETERPQSQFLHSFIYSHGRSAYSAAGKYVDRSSRNINRSQKHKCGNGGRAVSFLRVHKSDFLCSVLYSSQMFCCILPTYTGLTWRCLPDAWRLVSRALFTTLTQTWPLSRRVIHQSIHRYPDTDLDLSILCYVHL